MKAGCGLGMGLVVALSCAHWAVPCGADKLRLARHFAGRSPSRGIARASPSPPSPPRGLSITATTGTVVNDSECWANYAYAEPEWARGINTAFSLGGQGAFAMRDWDGIGEYACQGALIAEKLLALGGAAERGLVASWLYTLPVSVGGQAWEAQNSQWHVATQGQWESSAEALLMFRVAVAHGAISPDAFQRAPDRLVCVSRDGGASFALAGSPQPGLSDADCTRSPTQLLESFPLGSVQPMSGVPALFVDVPSAAFPGPSSVLDNAARLLSQTFILPSNRGDATHIALPLIPRISGPRAWPATVTVVDVDSGDTVVTAPLPDEGANGTQWFVVVAPMLAGRAYLVVLTAEAVPPAGAQASDSWFLGSWWLTNASPAVEGGASQVTFGQSPEWLRNATATDSDPRLVTTFLRTAADAMTFELRRVKTVAQHQLAPFGVSLAQQAALLLAWCLALSSQVPQVSAIGGYDIFVIPDPAFRGSLEDGVNSGCSYYDLLRIGFASSYLNLRVIEAVDAGLDLQIAGILPAVCVFDATGSDNAFVFTNMSTPCYSHSALTAIARALRVAVGNRFSTADGTFVDWFGCATLATSGNVSACGLHLVSAGVPPPGSPLNAVVTTFIPSLALAVKLGIPAGGLSVNATQAAFFSARNHSRTGLHYGPGWFHTALRGLEANAGGARSIITQSAWRLVDAQGFALHSLNETGDWHLYNPSFLSSGGTNGYGQFEAQAENGGRFFSTTAFVWNAGPYTDFFADYSRLVANIVAIGRQIEAGDTSTPLLPLDRAFLSTPTSVDTSGIVFDLCAAARRNFPNVTDMWGEKLCNYYQDLAWALPENGVVLVSAIKSLLGVNVYANRSLVVNGSPAVLVRAGQSWSSNESLPEGFPKEISGVAVRGLIVGSASVDVNCSVPAVCRLECVMRATAIDF